MEYSLSEFVFVRKQTTLHTGPRFASLPTTLSTGCSVLSFNHPTMSALLICIASIWILFCLIVVPILLFIYIRRTADLEKSLRALQSRVWQSKPSAQQDSPQIDAPLIPFPSVDVVHSPKVSVPVATPAPPPPPSEPKPTPVVASSSATTASHPQPPIKAVSKDKEVLWIARGAPIVGGLFAIACLVFFGIHFFEDVPTWARVLQMVGACALCYGIGIWVTYKKLPLGSVLQGIGLAGLYLTSVAAYALQPTKITDSIWVAAAMQIFSLCLILLDSLWKNRETMATCAVAFGYFSVILLYYENIVQGILPSALVLLLITCLLRRIKRWVSPLSLALLLVSLLYGWFATADWKIPELHYSLQLLGFPLLMGCAGIAMLHQRNEESCFHTRMILLLISVLFGGFINYMYGTQLGIAYTFDWFVWIAVPLLLVWGCNEYIGQRRSQAGIALLLSTLLTLVWLSENASVFTIALAGCMLIVQHKVYRGRLVQTSFLVAVAGAIGNLLYEAGRLPQWIGKYEVSSIAAPHFLQSWNWLVLAFIAAWVAIAAILFYAHPPMDRHRTLHQIFRFWMILLGISGFRMAFQILPDHALSAILLMALAVYGMEWKSPQPVQYTRNTLLLTGALTILVSPQESPLWISCLFLAVLWTCFTVYRKDERAAYTAAAVLATLGLLPHSSFQLGKYVFSSPWILTPLTALLATICILRNHQKRVMTPFWIAIPLVCILYLVTLIFSPEENPIWPNFHKLSSLQSPDVEISQGFILFTLACVPILLILSWLFCSINHRFRSNLAPIRSLLPFSIGLALTGWIVHTVTYIYPVPDYIVLPILLLPALIILIAHNPRFIPLTLAPWIALLLIFSTLLLQLIAIIAGLLDVAGHHVFDHMHPAEVPMIFVLILILGILALRDPQLTTYQRFWLNWLYGGFAILQILFLPIFYTEYQWISTYLALSSALLLALGLYFRLKPWRILGLCLFPLAVVWIMVFDLNNAFHRILACGGLAVLCLLVGWIYQKYRQHEAQ
jgi:hypothetical protein